MFSKLSILGLALSVAPFVSALVLHPLENARSGGDVVVKWDNEAADAAKFGTFTIELIHEEFRRAFAIANNVDPNLGQLALTLPIVPVGPGYTLEAVNIGNINDVYAASGQFSVEEGISTAQPSTTAPVPSASTEPQPTIKPPSGSTTVFGTVVKPSNTPPSSGSTKPSGSASSGPQPSTINPNGGVKSVASYLVVAASALLGALVVGA